MSASPADVSAAEELRLIVIALVNRVEVLERALGLPARVPILVCDACGHEIAELRQLRNDICPRCCCRALRPDRHEQWPLTANEADA